MNVILFNENMRLDIRLNTRESLVHHMCVYIYVYVHRMKKLDARYATKSHRIKLVIELFYFYPFNIFKSIIDLLFWLIFDSFHFIVNIFASKYFRVSRRVSRWL